MNETTEREEAQTGSGSRHDRMVTFPNAYAGLCIRNEKLKQTVNVHFIRDGVVYYGKYDDALDNQYDDGCFGVYRTPVDDFNGSIGRAVMDGHAVYSLLER